MSSEVANHGICKAACYIDTTEAAGEASADQPCLYNYHEIADGDKPRPGEQRHAYIREERKERV